MNRRNVLSLSAIMALGLTLVPGSAISQQKPLKDQRAHIAIRGIQSISATSSS